MKNYDNLTIAVRNKGIESIWQRGREEKAEGSRRNENLKKGKVRHRWGK